MNSSTSSNRSEYEMQYSCRRNDRVPWYPTIGQPLIYYAQLQPECCRQKTKSIKKYTPNCFVKAFRWYTQEHVPFNSMVTSNVNKADMKDFASWLDNKYNEYLQSSLDQKQCILDQSSTLQIFDSANKTKNDGKERKKLSRIKSPWKKRQRSENKGDIFLKSNQSIEVILKPKQLSRPVSECCQRNKALSCNNFNSTTQSDTSALEKKLKPKSRSLTSVLKEREMYAFEVNDYVPYKVMNNDVLIKPDTCDRRSSKGFVLKKFSKIIKNTRITNNVSCQCSNAKFVNDASSQFEKKTSRSNICLCEDIAATTLRKKPSRCLSLEKPKRESSFDVNGGKNKTVSSTLNDSVQTSDHSINLEDKIQYPLFMKIICADKFR